MPYRGSDAEKAYKKKYREEHKEEAKIKQKAYRELHKDEIKIRRAEERKKDFFKRQAYKKKYNSENSEKIKEYAKKYRAATADKRREYSIKNRGRKAAYEKERRKDPLYRMTGNMRTAMYQSLIAGGFKKLNSINSSLGCSWIDFQNHLQSKFLPGMSMDNYGPVWHVDHVIPLNTAKTSADVVKLFHYTNLQPLFAKDNLSKGHKIIS